MISGEKSEIIPDYMRLNRQIARMEKLVFEEILAYNFALAYLFR